MTVTVTDSAAQLAMSRAPLVQSTSAPAAAVHSASNGSSAGPALSRSGSTPTPTSSSSSAAAAAAASSSSLSEPAQHSSQQRLHQNRLSSSSTGSVSGANTVNAGAQGLRSPSPASSDAQSDASGSRPGELPRVFGLAAPSGGKSASDGVVTVPGVRPVGAACTADGSGRPRSAHTTSAGSGSSVVNDSTSSTSSSNGLLSPPGIRGISNGFRLSLPRSSDFQNAAGADSFAGTAGAGPGAGSRVTGLTVSATATASSGHASTSPERSSNVITAGSPAAALGADAAFDTGSGGAQSADSASRRPRNSMLDALTSENYFSPRVSAVSAGAGAGEVDSLQPLAGASSALDMAATSTTGGTNTNLALPWTAPCSLQRHLSFDPRPPPFSLETVKLQSIIDVEYPLSLEGMCAWAAVDVDVDVVVDVAVAVDVAGDAGARARDD
mgnify:CR=1 FL=1